MSAELPIQMLDLRRDRKKRAKPGRAPANSETHVAVLVRMPRTLKATIYRSAKASFRTLTGEINRRLEDSYSNESIDEHGVIVVHTPPARK